MFISKSDFSYFIIFESSKRVFLKKRIDIEGETCFIFSLCEKVKGDRYIWLSADDFWSCMTDPNDIEDLVLEVNYTQFSV